MPSSVSSTRSSHSAELCDLPVSNVLTSNAVCSSHNWSQPGGRRYHYVRGWEKPMREVSNASSAKWAGRLVIAALMAGIVTVGCRGGGATPAGAAPASPPAATKPVFGTFGVDLATRKTATKPGDDFFAHTNGVWLDTFPIPDKASYG